MPTEAPPMPPCSECGEAWEQDDPEHDPFCRRCAKSADEDPAFWAWVKQRVCDCGHDATAHEDAGAYCTLCPDYPEAQHIYRKWRWNAVDCTDNGPQSDDQGPNGGGD